MALLPRRLGTLQSPRRAGGGLLAYRAARDRDGADELQEIAGRGIHVPDAGRDRREPAAVPVLRARTRGVWKRGQGDRVDATCWCSALLGSAYSVFAFFGMGREPFLWALALAAAGVPLYLWMRLRSGRES